MTRLGLSDAQGALIEPHCLGKKSDPGHTGSDTRVFMEAVLWIARTGAPWRDLPEVFGNWSVVFKRLFDAVAKDPDMPYAMTCGTIVKVPPRPRCKRGTQSQAIEAARAAV